MALSRTHLLDISRFRTFPNEEKKKLVHHLLNKTFQNGSLQYKYYIIYIGNHNNIDMLYHVVTMLVAACAAVLLCGGVRRACVV